MNRGKQAARFQEERLDKIMEMLSKQDRLLTNDVAASLNTTPATIRKDLNLLESEGLLRRTHGGAVKGKSLFRGLALKEKEKIKIAEKKRLVKEAANLISEGDTIILDSGSTTTLLAKEIKEVKGLTVITNAINIAYEMLDSEATVIVIGGSLDKDSQTTIGPLADGMLKRISSSKLFFGVDGIDLDIGLSTPNILEANTTRTMMEVSGESILLTDDSKFGRRSLGVICGIDNLDRLITTKCLSSQEIDQLEKVGVEITMV